MALPFDQIFSSTVLNLLIPDASLAFPPDIPTDLWLEKAQTPAVERKEAFFDEQLQSFLVLRVENPVPESTVESNNPPDSLLELLAHVQVSLEASYISSVPTVVDTQKNTTRLMGTPRMSLLHPKSTTRQSLHPSILPPSTPNPTPSTADEDRKYSTSEGTMLVATIWGSSTVDDSPEAFALWWSEKEEKWIAVYRMSITVCPRDWCTDQLSKICVPDLPTVQV